MINSKKFQKMKQLFNSNHEIFEQFKNVFADDPPCRGCGAETVKWIDRRNENEIKFIIEELDKIKDIVLPHQKKADDLFFYIENIYKQNLEILKKLDKLLGDKD